ncbi:MAG: hypothetical protein JSW71_06375 [Gemmatimonadota bacterium]|nr:MAG: hypothetical protein JSW71_06375 [Gemmatimonadota bacterium]
MRSAPSSGFEPLNSATCGDVWRQKLFDRALKSVTPDLGVMPVADSAYVTELTGVKFRPAEEAVKAAGQSLIDHSVV